VNARIGSPITARYRRAATCISCISRRLFASRALVPAVALAESPDKDRSRVVGSSVNRRRVVDPTRDRYPPLFFSFSFSFSFLFSSRSLRCVLSSPASRSFGRFPQESRGIDLSIDLESLRIATLAEEETRRCFSCSIACRKSGREARIREGSGRAGGDAHRLSARKGHATRSLPRCPPLSLLCSYFICRFQSSAGNYRNKTHYSNGRRCLSRNVPASLSFH